jgi:hypothetical protein
MRLSLISRRNCLWTGDPGRELLKFWPKNTEIDIRRSRLPR